MDPSNSDRVVVSTYGTAPPSTDDGGLEGWNEDKDDEDKGRIVPIPVKFEITPIVNLFTKESLDERHNIR